jgi:signal transduction histidine kinase
LPASLRSNRPVLVSIVAIGVPLLLLLLLIWRSLDRFDVAAGRLLRLASAQLAEAVAQRVHRDFTGSFFSFLEQIDHEQVRRLDLAQIAEQIRAREPICFVDGVFVGGASAAGEQLHFLRIDSPCAADPAAETSPSPAAPDPALSSVLWREVKESVAIRRTVGFWDHEYGGARHHVLLHLLYNSHKRHQLDAFLGFTVSHRRLREHYFPEVVQEAIARQRMHLSPLPAVPVVSVFEGGDEVYRSARSLQNDYEAEIKVPLLFLDTRRFREWENQPPAETIYLRVRTAYDSGTVSTLVAQHARQQRWLWAATALLVMIGVVLTARATFREVRLARVKMEFFSRLSHDLRTPLANIRLFADTLKARPHVSPEKAQQYYEILSSQAQRLAHRIGGILDFARIEAGTRSYPMEPVDLKATLRQVIDAYRYELDQGGFRPDFAVADDLMVVGNPDGLEQLFGNLVENAIKYSNGNRFLRISAAREDGCARVDVTDSGIGIPREEQRKVFEKFYRIRQSAGSRHGSGLGLATVAHVVRAHKGRISVSSEPGHGTTFTVYLPLFRDKDNA